MGIFNSYATNYQMVSTLAQVEITAPVILHLHMDDHNPLVLTMEIRPAST
jgi:hypothetical protein